MTSQRLRPHEERPHRVYTLRDSAGTALYVGVTSQVEARIRRHLREQPWADEIDASMTDVTDEMSWEDALALEQAKIQSLAPRHNERRTNGSAYVAMGVRDVIAAETRLRRAARTGDPEAVAAFEAWRDEQEALTAAGQAHVAAVMDAAIFGRRRSA